MSPPLELEHIGCPLCDAVSEAPVLSGPDYLCGVPGIFSVVRCQACRHVYLNPRPTEETIGVCYPPDYGPYKQTAAPTTAASAETTPPKTAWYLSKPMRMIPGLRSLYYWLTDCRTDLLSMVETPAGRAIDIGCSSGDFLVRLRESGWDAEGVELMPGPADQSRRLGFVVHNSTLEDAALGTDAFDVAFASMVLEHVYSPKQMLNEVARIVRGNGTFVFTVPNFACWERFVFRRYWRGLELPRHLHHYTPGRLVALLEECGFRDINVVHQRNLNNVVASFGLLFRRRRWTRRLGQKLIDFTDNPTMWWQLVLAIPAKVAAFCRQGGRLTVTARVASEIVE